MKVRTKFASVIDFATASGWFHGANPAARSTWASCCRPTARPFPRCDAVERGAGVHARPRCLRHVGGARLAVHRAHGGTCKRDLRRGWSEIQGDTWNIPAERMKENQPHSVPLAAEVLALLGPHGQADELIFAARPARSSTAPP